MAKKNKPKAAPKLKKMVDKTDPNYTGGAPKGNQFWKLRSKHGCDRLFASPELMWEAACEYFQWCVDNPFLKSEAKVVNTGDYRSEVEIVELPVLRPFTMQGLTGYLCCNTQYFSDFKKRLKPNEKPIDKDFALIVTRIEEVVYDQKFSGAAANFFNANIIARDLGLKDKQEVSQTNFNVDTTELTPQDIKKLKDELDTEY